MKNKKANATIVIVTIIALLALVVGIFAVAQNFGGGNETVEKGCGGSNPTISLSAVDKLQEGTAVTLSGNYTFENGVYVSSPVLSTANSEQYLLTASNYLNGLTAKQKLICGANGFDARMYAYQIPTYKIYNADGTATLTDNVAGGATNESSSSNAITNEIKISGTPLKSTGQMLVIIEYTNNTEVATSGISLKGATAVDTPQWYSNAGAGSATKAFLLPAIVDGGSESYDLTLSPRSGQSIVSAGVYTAIYTLNPYVLDTISGKLLDSSKGDAVWQDSNGADKTIASVDYDFYIGA